MYTEWSDHNGGVNHHCSTHQTVEMCDFGAGQCRRSEQSRGVYMDELESGHVSFLEQEGAECRSRVKE
jgi:hypothetical protein